MASKRSKAAGPAERARQFLREEALAYPEAHEEFPWGECAIKVRGKIFTFVNQTEGGGCSVTVKLPHSQPEALLLPFAEMTHYGMGKHGWVTCRFEADEDPPVDLFVEWIEESYRAIAPKKLVAMLDADEAEPAPKKAAKKKAAKKTTKKKAATKKKVAKKKPAATKKPVAKKKAKKKR